MTDTERLEKILVTKKELTDERVELVKLLERLPKASSKEVQALKEKLSKNHQELMEILQNEEKFSREFQGKNS